MYINKYSLPRPSEDALEKCHCITIGNPAFRVWAIKKYCIENNLSLVWSELVDSTDVGVYFDEVAAYYLIDPADATFSNLKYK